MGSHTTTDPAALGIAALLRTVGALYGVLWAVAAIAAPWGRPGQVAVVCLLPLAPVLMLVITRALVEGAGQRLREGPFGVVCVATAAVLMAERAALGGSGMAYGVIFLTAVVAAALATQAFSAPRAEREEAAARRAEAFLATPWGGSRTAAGQATAAGG